LASKWDADRRQQLDAMLKDDGLTYAGSLAASYCQSRALGLKPWEAVPCELDDEKPIGDPQRRGLFKAWEVRRHLLAAGLSAFEPDPIGALAAIEARPAPAA
jgi:hypothetical protein